MTSIAKFSACLFALVFVSHVSVGAVRAAKQSAEEVKVSGAKPDDDITVQSTKPNAILVAIKSHSGSGRATLKGLNSDGSKIVTLRFYLKGLEGLQISNGIIALNAAVSVRDKELQIRQWKSGDDNAPLEENDPSAMRIAIVGGEDMNQPHLPLKKGYFEVALPGSLFQGKPEAITLSWIDFYR